MLEFHLLKKHWKIWKIDFFILKVTRRFWYESASGSVRQRYRSENSEPHSDPHQNVMDPEHWMKPNRTKATKETHAKKLFSFWHTNTQETKDAHEENKWSSENWNCDNDNGKRDRKRDTKLRCNVCIMESRFRRLKIFTILQKIQILMFC